MNTTSTATDLVAIQTAVDKLNRSSVLDSLDALVKAKTRRSLLLVDASHSMSARIRSGERRIDALRKTVSELRQTHKVPVAAFGLKGMTSVEVVDTVPEPQGSTPMDDAIEFGQAQGANHLIIVTDGEPNDEESTFAAARAFGGPIDTFYIGDGNDRGSRFARELAEMTGGTCGMTDLGQPKQLAAKLAGLLGNGADVI